MKKLMCLFFVLALTGCQTLLPKPEKEIVFQTKEVYVFIPDELIIECQSARPPEKELYLNSSWETKEELLTIFSISQTSYLRKCASTIENIRKWKTKQLEIHTPSS